MNNSHKRFYILSLISLFTLFINATPFVVEDFESYPEGTQWKMWDRWGNPVTSTAEVAVDPTNSRNKVLKVTVKGWNCFPEFNIPEQYAGNKIKENFKGLRFRMFRPNEDTNDYKQFHFFFGNDQQYVDNGYPYQGDRNTWQQRTYDFGNITDGSTATALRFGIHCDVSYYYLDDIKLYGEYDDYTIIESGKIDISANNTSTSYASYTTATYIPEGKKLDFYTARYTDIYAPFAGSGTLNIYSGGERTYLGEHSGKKYNSWYSFTGDVHIYPYKEKISSAGFYGLVMGTNGKSFSPENIEGDIADGKACNALQKNRVFLHNGATIAFENNSRAAIFGELNTDAGSRIQGYYKTSDASSYVIVGQNNTDATMAGTIANTGSTTLIGMIKMGKGTYTLTANNNAIGAAMRVIDGRVNICNDAAAALKSKLSGGTGAGLTASKVVAYVMKNGVLGGTGNIGGTVDVYGTVEPGTATQTGKLTIQDYTSANAALTLRVHPNSVLRFKIRNAEDYDQLVVNKYIHYSNATEDFGTSEEMPRIKIVLADGYDIKVGDEFTILTAPSRLSASNWNFSVSLPEKLTWKIEDGSKDGTYALTLRVTSLEDDPGNIGNDNENEGKDEEDEESIPESFKEDGSYKSLREYADAKGLRIGVAVPTYSIPLDNTSNVKTKTIMEQFNMVVNENELKWDSCEPSQGNFNFGGGDALLWFANNNNMYMRGHTLAWHSQVAEWVSVDGKKNDKGWTKKELMDILKNHIYNVVTHYKGKIGEWDVVNECLDDDQSIVRNNPNGYKLRAQSIWTTVCGEEFIDSAFVWAHRFDPDAKLILNDYDNETMGNAKAQAFYNLAKRLKKDGRPIDGVGFQCHMDAGRVNVSAIKKNLERYAELDMQCVITELDLGISTTSEEQKQIQAKDYYRIVKMAEELPHCKSVLIWGLSDDLSWRSSNPLPWSASMEKKPAYYGVREALKAAVPYIKGDVDSDGEVTISDANAIVNHYLGVSEVSNKSKADIDGDGNITISDANAVVNIYKK